MYGQNIQCGISKVAFEIPCHIHVPYSYTGRCDMAFIEPMHRNKPNITYLLITHTLKDLIFKQSWNFKSS